MADAGSKTDTSMYSQQPAVQFNPMLANQALSQGAGILNALTQNKMLQQMYRSNVAGSQQWMKAVGPNGALDPGKAASGIAGDPNIINKGDAINQAIGARTGQATATTAEAGASSAQIANLQDKAKLVDSLLYPVLSHPNAKYADGVATATKVFNTYPSLFTPQEKAAFLSSIPKTGGPAALNDYANNLHARVMSPTEATTFTAPNPTVVDRGGQLQVLDTNPRSNKTLIGTTIKKGMTPEGAAAPRVGPTVNGQPTAPTAQQAQDIVDGKAYIDAATGNLVYKPGESPGSLPPIEPGPSRTAPLTVAAVPPGAQPKIAMRPTAPPVISPLMPTGAPLGHAEAVEAVGAGSGKQYDADLAQADTKTFRRSVFPLEQAIPLLEKLGPQGTGPGTETLNNIKSFALSMGLPGVDAEKIKGYDEAKKYLTDFVNQNSSGGTNDKLAAAFAGNPSVHISNAAASDVAKSALALRRMQQAQVMEFQKTGKPEDQYTRWASGWATGQDPRAYGFDLMSPQAQRKLISSLPLPGSEEEARTGTRKAFLESLAAAHRSGLVQPPDRVIQSTPAP